eukprot:gene41973-56837_t
MLGFIGMVVGLIQVRLLPEVWGFEHPATWIVSLAAAVALGGVIGLINGLIVTKVKVNSVIATLGVGTILTGLSFAYSAGVPITAGVPEAFLQVSLGRWLLGIPNNIVIMVIVLGGLWVLVERTALAEAEIEYADYESDTIWVKFPIHSGNGAFGTPDFESLDASVIIWTTTPWTIPANRAISYSSRINYGLYEVTKAPEGNWASTGEKYVIADKLAADTFAKAKVEEFIRLSDVDCSKIVSTVHPLRGLGDGYRFEVPLLDGEHVTDDVGTGFVHTAPGHGLDDFGIWMDSARKIAALGIDTTIPYVVDDAGFYTKDAPGFEGARILDDSGKKGDANNRVIAALAERKMIIARGRLKHQYPHSWRSKKPILFRNTPQWFVYMDRDIMGAAGDTLRARALNAIDATVFYPAAGQNRLRAMIADRPDWVLSRQR